MSKVLIVKNNTNIPDCNVGDVIATYDEVANIYSKEDFLNLKVFSDLELAIQGKDPETILAAKMALAQKVCKKEQLLILTDVFGVIEFSEKTLTELQDDINAVEPERKIVWIDSSGIVKEINKEPAKPIRYENGEFKTNLDVVENDVIINKTVSVTSK